MKPPPLSPSLGLGPAGPAASEIMLLPDGRILAHHLTPEIAALLQAVAGNPSDPSRNDDSLPLEVPSAVPPVLF